MKKLMMVLMSAAIILTGCSSRNLGKQEDVVNNHEFEVSKPEDIGSGNDLTIIKHKETGKRFVIYKGFYKGGIAPLD